MDFRNDSVVVAFEWIEAHKRGVSYIAHTVPPANNIAYYYHAGASVQLQIFYNTVYNVSMKSSCGENSTTTYITLNFSKFLIERPLMIINYVYHTAKCAQPMMNDSIRIIVDDPAIVGSNVSFTCPNGLVLIGPKQSTCMESGHWQPDPRESECKGVDYKTSVCTWFVEFLDWGICHSKLIFAFVTPAV